MDSLTPKQKNDKLWNIHTFHDLQVTSLNRMEFLGVRLIPLLKNNQQEMFSFAHISLAL